MKSSGKGDPGILLSCCFAWCKGGVLPAPSVTAPAFGKPVVLLAFPREKLAPCTWQGCGYSSFSNTCHFTSKADSLHARTPRRKTYGKHLIFIVCIPNYLKSMLCFPFYVCMLPLQPLTQLSDRFGAETPLSGGHSGKDPTLHKDFASKLLPVVAPKFLRLQEIPNLFIFGWLEFVRKRSFPL